MVAARGITRRINGDGLQFSFIQHLRKQRMASQLLVDLNAQQAVPAVETVSKGGSRPGMAKRLRRTGSHLRQSTGIQCPDNNRHGD